MKKLVFCLLFLCSNTFSQNLIEVFRNDVPKMFYDDNQFRKQIDLNIKAISNLDPDLLYYYFMALNEYSSDLDGKTQYKLILNKLGILKKNVTMQKRKWINSQIKLLEKNEDNSHFETVAINFFRSEKPDAFEIKEQSYLNLEIDENLQDYYAAKLLGKDSNLRFEQSVDYKVKRKKIEKSIIEKYKNYYEAISTKKNQKIEYFEISDHLFNHWYLFKDNSLSLTEPYKLIQEIVHHKYSKNNNPVNLFRISFGFNYNNFQSLDHDLRIEEMNYSNSYSFNSEMKQLFATFGLTIPIMEKKGFLSEVHLDFSYAKGLSEKTFTLTSTLTELPPFKGKQEVYKLVNFIDGFNEVKLNSLNSVLLSIEFPLLYPYENINFSSGFSLMFNSLKYTKNYSYKYRHVERGSLFGGGAWIDTYASGYNSAVDENVKDEKWMIFPFFIVNYNAPLGLNFSVKLSSRYYGLNIGYSFLRI